MPMYLFRTKPTRETISALAEEGIENRTRAVADLVAKAGGMLHGYYMVSGSTDGVVLIQFPSRRAADGFLFAVASTGVASSVSYEELLAPAEADEVLSELPEYGPPGG